MTGITRGTVLVALMLALAGPSALAAQERVATPSGTTPLVMTAINLTMADEAEAGRTRAGVDDMTALPGDVFEYRLAFTNPLVEEVRDVVLQNPIPAGMMFVPGSAAADWPSVRLEYSIDEGESWSESPEVEVLLEDGSTERRPAPPEMYTNVRWTLQGVIAPGAKIEAAYRTRVTGAAPLTHSGSSG